MKSVPGVDTGFVIRRTRVVGVGATAEHVTENVVDTGLLDMFLKIEKQAAQEKGQWTEKANPATNAPILDNIHIYVPEKRISPQLTPPPKQVGSVIEIEHE